MNILVTLPSQPLTLILACVADRDLAGGGVGAYNGLITEALGFTALQTDFLAMATGGFQLIVIFIGIMTYRRTRWTLGSAAICIIPQLVCVITMMSVTPTVPNRVRRSQPYFL